jgi:hypothetical protein
LDEESKKLALILLLAAIIVFGCVAYVKYVEVQDGERMETNMHPDPDKPRPIRIRGANCTIIEVDVG